MVAIRLSDRADEIRADIQIKSDRHQFQVSEVVVFVFVDTFKPGVELLIIQFVVPSADLRHVFAGQCVSENLKNTATGVRNKIEPLAEPLTKKTGRIAHP